ncbi:glycosyltransferase family 39 protein [Chloracidobacterium validum]|uniref:Glycosyltransferase family 39 protein n=1 Tax=Chloracidobacterium validum TaxID=2821543 RepID=A0ABX8BDA4_9BACT|nr:glycosyltransferase family 39 protein [Chloracidobacterium validum]QUW04666.1 glycosyltransferase family 39 protein [Chloracidobacterium validum]
MPFLGCAEPTPGRTPRLGITRTDWLTVVLFTALYILYVGHEAVTRAFWIDELFTYYVVTMPTWAGTWDLLRNGPDQNPPLFYALTRLVVGVFGESEWAFRLPAVVGYWLLCLSLYTLGRRIGQTSTTGLIALVTPLVTGTGYYASEARPYGLMLGCLGVGLVSYAFIDPAEPPTWQRRAVLGLGSTLALAMAFHYLVLLPIGCLWLVEGYRTWRTRQVRWRVWGALAAPLAVLAYNWPLLTEQSKLPYWKMSLRWSELSEFYWWMVSPLTGLAFLTLVAVVAVIDRLGRRSRHHPSQEEAQPSAKLPSEWLWLGFVLLIGLPVGWMVLMKVTGRTMFTPRYLLPAVVGLTLLVMYVVGQLTAHHARWVARGIWTILAAVALWTGLQPWQLVLPRTEAVSNLPDPNQPVLVDCVMYLQLKHYFGDQLPRVVHVFGVLTYPQPEDPSRGLRAILGNPRAPRFEDPNAFFEANERFYIVYCKDFRDENLKLRLEKHQVPVVRQTSEYLIYDFRWSDIE